MACGRAPGVVMMRRIQSELRDWSQNAPEGCCLESAEPLTSWVILIQGPESVTGPHLYANDLFRLRVNFTDAYPLQPPEVYFDPRFAPVHPHIYSNGHICLDILYAGARGGWSPALTINKVALSLRSMLASNTDKRRPAGDKMYCMSKAGRSPLTTEWQFDDDTV